MQVKKYERYLKLLQSKKIVFWNVAQLQLVITFLFGAKILCSTNR
jgi:hypothetical protein